MYINPFKIKLEVLLKQIGETKWTPVVAGTPNNEDSGGFPTIPTTTKKSYHHLAILKHHHHNNEYNVDNNNYNNYIKNTISPSHA